MASERICGGERVFISCFVLAAMIHYADDMKCASGALSRGKQGFDNTDTAKPCNIYSGILTTYYCNIDAISFRMSY